MTNGLKFLFEEHFFSCVSQYYSIALTRKVESYLTNFDLELLKIDIS